MTAAMEKCLPVTVVLSFSGEELSQGMLCRAMKETEQEEDSNLIGR